MNGLLGREQAIRQNRYNRRAMTGLPPYFDLIRQMSNRFDYRLRLVQTARQQGIKAAARLFQTTVPTVRKWLRHYQQENLSGLQGTAALPSVVPTKPRPPSSSRSWPCASKCPPSGRAA